jgi:hypothetical protein
MCIPFVYLHILLALLVPLESNAQNFQEYQIKAAFIYNFLKFVEWPNPGGESHICIFGENPFGEALDQIVNSGDVADVSIKKLTKSDVVPTTCKIAYIAEDAFSESLIKKFQLSPTLTVSDIPGFSDKGGMIELTLESGKVRFMISLETAKKQGLSISSKLLSLSLKVK